MKKIIIIGANNFQNSLILKAKEKGYETHVFAWKCGDVGEKTADFFYPISIVEKEKILTEAKKIKPDAVASIASDLAVITVNYVARGLGLVANSEWSDMVSTNKYNMRQAMSKYGVVCPWYCKLQQGEKIENITSLKYPLIVKPTDRSGSRGIRKVDCYEELCDAVANAQMLSFENTAIVEEFIEGKEYSCECISYDGVHHMLAITEKFTTGEPHFIEIGHMQPANITEKMQGYIRQIVFNALDALHIEYGASHTEFKIDNCGEIRIIEVGARMGGDCIGSHLVQMSTGNDFVGMVIDVASGKQPEIKSFKSKKNAAIRFIMDKNDLSLMDKLNENFQITEIVTLSDKYEEKVTDSSTRYGYFLIFGTSQEKIERKLFTKIV